VPTITDIAVCVRIWDWSETSQTVGLFLREHGLLRGVAKGSKRAKGAFSGGFEMLTIGQVVAITKPSGAMPIVTEWDLQDPLAGVRATLSGFYHASYAGDLAQHGVSEGDPHPSYFDALVAALHRFEDPDAAEHPAALARFQWETLVETGFKPDLELPSKARTYAFNPSHGRLESDPGRDIAGAWRVRAGTVELLVALDAGEVFGADRFEVKTVERANRLLGSYLARLLGRALPSASAALGTESA